MTLPLVASECLARGPDSSTKIVTLRKRSKGAALRLEGA